LLEVEELQEKATQGRTQPWLCRLSDDQLYYIKGPQATTKGLINEAVCVLRQSFWPECASTLSGLPACTNADL
jgi:hypothetical protein